jgi:hypothetical protein
VSRADMVWDAQKVTKLDWLNSPFVGNGMLGVMLNTEADGCGTLWPNCSRTPSSPVLRLKIGRIDVWDTRVKGSQHSVGDQQFDTPRLPIGNLFLSSSQGMIASIAYRVNLYDANITGATFSASGEQLFNFSLLVHALDHVVVLAVLPPGAAEMVFIPDRAVPPICASDPFNSAAASSPTQAPSTKPCPLSTRTPGQHYAFNPNVTCTPASCQQKLLGGGDYATAWGEHKTAAGVFLLTVANSMPAFVPQPASALTTATATIRQFASTSLHGSLEAHWRWWQSYWPVHYISIPDTVLEQYYIIQFYKLASATRCDGPDNCFAYDLNGPWLEVDTIWADYHWDLNTQVAHWLTMPGNRMREGQSLVEMVARNRANLTKSAKECTTSDPSTWCPPLPSNFSSDSAFLVTTCGPGGPLHPCPFRPPCPPFTLVPPPPHTHTLVDLDSPLHACILRPSEQRRVVWILAERLSALAVQQSLDELSLQHEHDAAGGTGVLLIDCTINRLYYQ